VHLDVNESIMLARTDVPPGSELLSPSLAPDAEINLRHFVVGNSEVGREYGFC
jgi:hypothetical protein